MQMDKEEIFRIISAIGRAALTLDIENSHSGNISMKCKDEDGNEFLAITATGSQKGELTRGKICYPSLDKTNHGHFKSSTETDIHAEILKMPGRNATVHGHTRFATVETMDDAPVPKENPRKPLVPVDPLGVRYLGEVPVDFFAVASGSKEMAQTVAKRLSGGPVSIVQSHGTFSSGASVEEAFFNLCLVEHAGEAVHYCGILGVDAEDAARRASEVAPTLRETMEDYSAEGNGRVDFEDEPETVESFLRTGFRIFESRYSPFHAGSMSVRCASTMLYAPKASMPQDLPGPLLELPLESGDEAAGSDLSIHRYLYDHTPIKSVVHCYVSEAQAVALAALQAAGGGDIPRVIPVDAEGGFLYPSIPVLPPNPEPGVLAKAMLDYKVAIVAFGGVWAAGEQSLGEALRHISSAKDICFYRIMAAMKGLNIAAMEPERARNW